MEEVEAEREPDPLFSVTETVRPVLDTVEADATPAIADNLAALRLRTCPMGYKVVDHTAAVFGDYYGQVRETAVKKAVKALHAESGTSSTGIGPKPRDLVSYRSPRPLRSQPGSEAASRRR